jgi:hypothetical protein
MSFTIQDTEWLLRLIMASEVSGKDIEQAAVTVMKLKELHNKLLNVGV